MFSVTLKGYKPLAKLREYFFDIVGMKSCIPQNGHSFHCYYDSNGKAIDLLGWKRLMELECYVAAKNLGHALPLCTNVEALQAVMLLINGKKEYYHLVVAHNVFPEGQVGTDLKEILSCAKNTREFLSSPFNKYGEKESNQFCSAGTIDLEKLIEVNYRYKHPPSEP